ncbi:uroporphyrinogen-III synthase [Arcanobacterium wilhelmae]|uniref:Uroporphyrinogen-III synthase n=1 Tax=Arcanobacterium wilhelmae TaxID=1803177 RepID=A0ABT9NB96_9ACTO|nr:uroporphyrinogen-III synthase [Arcanobacterium wilhelmae]MDP9800990.1 uroporphyrinogen-III synthase [Arcanobacterium wilhelmae]WFN90350.1 uroporphyrinogen-III synthase [Arcanobacterium wilhelmae]
MRVAITRRGGALASGYAQFPLTRRRAWPDGVVALRQELAIAQEGTWLAVTSGFTFQVMREAGIEIPAGIRLACVGRATAAHAPFMPQVIGGGAASAAALAAQFPQPGENNRVIYPCSALASHVLEESLTQRGYQVKRLEIYTSDPEPEAVRALANYAPNAIVVTSGSAARALAAYYPQPLPALVAIGEPTASAIHECGFTPAAIAHEPTPAGIAAAVTSASREPACNAPPSPA